ncbi:peptidoglycan-binding protein [Streptomyces sp. NPDC005538]|uniref:peptidoglycan-binding protein n=1 Tax=unclassified Streptomyces TaxID=2593676 RepID=UPI0033AB0B25
MSRWKVLPAELDPRVRQLVVRLRRLKDHSGLSIRQMAARTGYSPKSWERYFGGTSLPPAEAVEALARICGEDPTRLLALREVAAEGWTTVRRPEPLPPEPAQQPHGGRALRVALVAGSVTLVLAVSSAVLLTIRLMDHSNSGATNRTSAPLAEPTPTPTSPYTCRVQRSDGRWYAGNSRTRQVNLAVGSAGPDVAEAQCLLRRAGISPGGIDGMFGPLTEHAVKEFQRRSGLVVDGMVGPHTWKALRG